MTLCDLKVYLYFRTLTRLKISIKMFHELVGENNMKLTPLRFDEMSN